MKHEHDADSAAPGSGKKQTASTGHGGSEQGLRVLSYLIAGMLFYGALGWLGDRAFDTSFLMPIGIIVGMALSIFMIIRRYGRVDQPKQAPDPNTTGRQEK